MPCPPAMPDGTEKVMFKVKEPASSCVGAVLRKNVPKLLAPLKEPMPKAVVLVKDALPAKVNWGTPLTIPVVEPLTVTSSARATPWLNVKKASRAIPKDKFFSNPGLVLITRSSVSAKKP